ncbi:hypothetical protein DSO57_1034085 [Entomophthora muscae]|uniref:Uncharacterized protein n=1 Tax=Entomophthora muscae TaxID=34485 RepID=A0ACC2RQW6_9FUNG|nr:hypothetical protein DSO57_1034085 [Entomophthora muscae]
MAMINPKDATTSAAIPRRATILKADGTTSSEFKVFPKQTPPIYALFLVMGHRDTLCPSTIEKVRAAEEVTQQQLLALRLQVSRSMPLNPSPRDHWLSNKWWLQSLISRRRPMLRLHIQNQPVEAKDPDKMDTQEAPSSSQATAQP